MNKELKEKAEHILDNRLLTSQIEDLKQKGLYKTLVLSMTEMIESDTFPNPPNLIKLENERMEWALATFPEATKFSSLEKLRDELKEVEAELHSDFPVPDFRIAEEYADCLMCLFDSAGRAGINAEGIAYAFSRKLKLNKSRKWVKNDNNTYSHVKQ